MDVTNKLAPAFALGLASLCTNSVAQQLPKSGTIKFHSGFKVSPEAVDVGEKRMQAHGSSVGVNYNDQGAGPFHGGPIACFWAFFARDNGATSKGYCALGDPDNDRIYTEFSGGSSGNEGSSGTFEVVAGTGKYAGMQGNGQFKCKMVGPNGQEDCASQLTYRLP